MECPVRTGSKGEIGALKIHELATKCRGEWALFLSVTTTALLLVWGKGRLADLSNLGWFAFVLAWLFGAILVLRFTKRFGGRNAPPGRGRGR